ncbi:unnamed protein product [Hymenolepis diminuta]|uniref:SpoU_methylase domain-containing protein n=2 Tax=Hymenolepis diminuta TaxID=6216 RepID=A0A0R3SCZ1_HYMDI|nr:unnamed protein product [Hymenolepis diminuta]
MSGLRELIEFICMENGAVAKHLDDTLLNRLETALYCQDRCHKCFWDDFYRKGFEMFMNNFEQALGDDDLSIGKLKIKFAILWQMKSHCTKEDFNRLRSILQKLILSDNVQIISTLQKFYEVNLTSDFSFDIYLEENNTCLLRLKKMCEQSVNIHAIRSTINLFILLLRAGIENGDSFEEFCTLPETPNERTLDFIQDLSTEIIRTSKASNDRTLYRFLTKLSEVLLERFYDSREELRNSERFPLLLMTVAPYNIDITPDFFDPSSATFGADLRALISCKMFQPCAVHKHLARLWFDLVMKFDRNAENNNGSSSILSSITTCTEDFTKLPHFVSEMPSDFVQRLWKVATLSLYRKAFDRAFGYYWLLFAKFCVFLSEEDKKKYLEWLYDIIIVSPDVIGEQVQVLDAFHCLYSSIHSFDMHEQGRVFERLYHLAKSECENLKASGGCLSFAYLLMRVYRHHMLNSDVAIHLEELQLVLADQLLKDPELAASSSVCKIHEGLFLGPLLRFPSCGIFSLEFYEGLVLLMKKCEDLKEKLVEDISYPGRLKAILLVCLFRSFENPSVLRTLKGDVGFYDIVKSIERDLLFASWDEDTTLSKTVVESYSSLVKYVSSIDYVPDLTPFLTKHKQRFEEIRPIRIGGATCPSCCENIANLLEDIVVKSDAAGDCDCGEG